VHADDLVVVVDGPRELRPGPADVEVGLIRADADVAAAAVLDVRLEAVGVALVADVVVLAELLGADAVEQLGLGVRRACPTGCRAWPGWAA
jgi:hypothetical protein